jgi:hypothetical protein
MAQPPTASGLVERHDGGTFRLPGQRRLSGDILGRFHCLKHCKLKAHDDLSADLLNQNTFKARIFFKPSWSPDSFADSPAYLSFCF